MSLQQTTSSQTQASQDAIVPFLDVLMVQSTSQKGKKQLGEKHKNKNKKGDTNTDIIVNTWGKKEKKMQVPLQDLQEQRSFYS